MSNFSYDKSALDKFTNELNAIADKMESLDGSKVSFDVLFDRNFMKLHTSAASFDEFLSQGNFNVKTEEDFESIPDDVFDKYVASNTDFSSWEEMFDTATGEYLESQLDF